MGNAINSNITEIYSATYAESTDGTPVYPDVDATGWVKCPPIKTTGAMGSTPSKLDSTTLSDRNMTYIDGLQDPGGSSTTYSINYYPDDIEKWFTLQDAGRKLWLIKIGEDGENGFFRYAGTATVSFPEMAVNTIVPSNVDILPSSSIEWSKDGTAWHYLS